MYKCSQDWSWETLWKEGQLGGRISNLKSGKEGLEPGCLSHVLGETAEGWAGEGGLGDRK